MIVHASRCLYKLDGFLCLFTYMKFISCQTIQTIVVLQVIDYIDSTHHTYKHWEIVKCISNKTTIF